MGRFYWLVVFAIAGAFIALPQYLAAQTAGRPATGSGASLAVPREATLANPSTFVPEASRLVPLPTLTEPQLKEFIHDLSVHLELAKGYRHAGADLKQRLPVVSDKIVVLATLTKNSGATADVLQFGYVLQPRRLPQLWIYGISIAPGRVATNRDFEPESLDPVLQAVLSERVKMLSKLSLAELESRILTLSYSDADGALFALRAMGYAAITDNDPLPLDTVYRGRDVALLAAPAEQEKAREREKEEKAKEAGAAAPNGFDAPPRNVAGSVSGEEQKPAGKFPAIRNLPSAIDFDRLPIIVKMPTPDAKSLGLVGGDVSQAQRDQSMGLTVIPQAAAPLSDTVTGGTAQLLVLYHPGYPDQFFKIKRIIESVIDKPARQVFVEGLVLEISNEGLRELGVRWDITRGNTQLQLGTLVDLSSGGNALSFTNDSLLTDPRRLLARINALVETNKAEVLSRPSVLTLDNRQATIRVGTDIPIATSKDASSGAASGRVSFSFQYLPTGILLNVRPRISDDGNEISMLIDATVSATVPNADLTVRDPVSGQVLASAPTISTRRVQTYARIVNNQPLIIGGLVSRDLIQAHDRVPFLGDIPVLGYLFGRKRDADARREVIIVLTPSLVTEEFRATKWQLPRDDDRFDQFGTVLFREAYRVRAEDLMDSAHFRFNQRFTNYRSIANELISRNADLANVYPFSVFRGARVPGEFVFVSGMMSRMLGRLKTHDPVNIDKLVFFEGVKGAAFKTESVGGLLKRLGDGATHLSFFQRHPGKALTLRFEYRRDSAAAADPSVAISEPLAEVNLVDCPDRETWKKLLWDLNQPTDGVQRHYTIVIHDPSDLDRLKLAIALKNTILANGNERGVIFDNFLPGKMIAMQEISPSWERTLDVGIARNFYHGELFYPAFANELERHIAALDKTLRRPDMARWTEGIKLP